MIKAPYNFVPLAPKVVFPEWADQISIDLPFEDGISGTINVKYTAQTPVFIGNGKGDNNSAIPNYKAANGKYAIPGSSLRGMLRNVMEIASFGKFNRVSDAALSVRDLQNRELYTNFFTRKDKDDGAHEALSKAGWLDQDNESKEWFLYPVEYYRVEDETLKSFFKIQNIKNWKNKDPKKRIGEISNKVELFFKPELERVHLHHKNPKTGKYLKLKYSKVENISSRQFSGSRQGFCVLTGVCGRKHMDFIFEDKNSKEIKIQNQIIKKFDDINVPNSANQKSGIALRRELEGYKKFGYPGLPVFYLTDQKDELFAMGLAQMFKLPYKYNLHEAISNSSPDNFLDKFDFAECIFGKVKDTTKKSSENNISLRGRVQFEDAITDSTTLAEKVDTVLGNPKATYYPNYIQQNTKNSKYKTLMNEDVQLRGWKRYPVRSAPNPLRVENGQEKVASHFSPLQEGTVFEGKIHFHNLKKEELGLLLWAITWGNDNTLSHAVGMGKSYGFGQLKAIISSLSFLNNNSSDNDYKEASDEQKNTWIKNFESYMEEKVVGWKNCPQLVELKAMANPKNAERPKWKLRHLSLKNLNDKNEFVEAKKEFAFLSSYSENSQESILMKHN